MPIERSEGKAARLAKLERLTFRELLATASERLAELANELALKPIDADIRRLADVAAGVLKAILNHADGGASQGHQHPVGLALEETRRISFWTPVDTKHLKVDTARSIMECSEALKNLAAEKPALLQRLSAHSGTNGYRLIELLIDRQEIVFDRKATKAIWPQKITPTGQDIRNACMAANSILEEAGESWKTGKVRGKSAARRKPL
ncbi:MAG: hypothetical protein AAF911_00840 [Planctomycetota bacterium]